MTWSGSYERVHYRREEEVRKTNSTNCEYFMRILSSLSLLRIRVLYFNLRIVSNYCLYRIVNVIEEKNYWMKHFVCELYTCIIIGAMVICWYLPFSSVFTHLTLSTSALRLTDTAAIAFIESPNQTPVLCYLQQFRAFFFLFFFLGGRTSQASSKTQMTGGEAKQLAKINTTNPLLPSVRDIVPKIPFAPFSNFSIYVDFQKRVAP